MGSSKRPSGLPDTPKALPRNRTAVFASKYKLTRSHVSTVPYPRSASSISNPCFALQGIGIDRYIHSSMALKRITKVSALLSPTRRTPSHSQAQELTDFSHHPLPGCTITPSPQNPFHWKATLTGPQGTPYEGGSFTLFIHFPSTYPFKDPKVNFQTKVYHPNVNSNGGMCLNETDPWSPVYTIVKSTFPVL